MPADIRILNPKEVVHLMADLNQQNDININLNFCISVSGGNSCKLPEAIQYNQRWRSLNHELSIHIDSDNTSFSFLKSGTLLEQVTCHSVDMIEAMEMNNADEVQMVAHVKSGW